MNNNEIKNFYVKLYKGGWITASAKRNISEGVVAIGFAFCSPEDTFDKRLGRTIATGRAMKRPFFVSGTNSVKAIKVLLSQAVKDSDARKIYNIPHWVPHRLIECES